MSPHRPSPRIVVRRRLEVPRNSFHPLLVNGAVTGKAPHLQDQRRRAGQGEVALGHRLVSVCRSEYKEGIVTLTAEQLVVPGAGTVRQTRTGLHNPKTGKSQAAG